MTYHNTPYPYRKMPYLMSSEEFVRIKKEMFGIHMPEESFATMNNDALYWFFVAEDSPRLRIITTFQATPPEAKKIHAAYNTHPKLPYVIHGGFADKSEMIEFVIDDMTTPEETIRNLAYLAGADDGVLNKL